MASEIPNEICRGAPNNNKKSRSTAPEEDLPNREIILELLLAHPHLLVPYDLVILGQVSRELAKQSVLVWPQLRFRDRGPVNSVGLISATEAKKLFGLSEDDLPLLPCLQSSSRYHDVVRYYTGDDVFDYALIKYQGLQGLRHALQHRSAALLFHKRYGELVGVTGYQSMSTWENMGNEFIVFLKYGTGSVDQLRVSLARHMRYCVLHKRYQEESIPSTGPLVFSNMETTYLNSGNGLTRLVNLRQCFLKAVLSFEGALRQAKLTRVTSKLRWKEVEWWAAHLASGHPITLAMEEAAVAVFATTLAARRTCASVQKEARIQKHKTQLNCEERLRTLRATYPLDCPGFNPRESSISQLENKYVDGVWDLERTMSAITQKVEAVAFYYSV